MTTDADPDALRADLGAMTLAIFDRLPLRDQPKAAVFLGPAAATVLNDLKGRIRKESRRGKSWEEHPLHLIARHGDESGAQDLSGALAHLRELDVDPSREALYLWAAPVRQRSCGFPVEFLNPEKGLPALAARHGLIVLQTHQSPQKEPDGSEAEELLPAGEFLIKMAGAGLFPRPDRHRNYPEASPFTSATLSWFEKRPYAIRRPRMSDMEALIRLEAECWPEALRASSEEIRARIEGFPQGQCAAILDGQVVGVIYSQRIERTDPLFECDFREAASLHRPEAPIVQLLAANVLPEVQHLGLGDQLLEFMLQYSSSLSGVERVVAVTLCRDYPRHASIPMEEYIHKRSKAGYVLDPILRFHEAHGATIERAVPGYRPQDADNQGAGVLVSYDIFNRRRQYSSAVVESVKDLAAVIEECIKEVLGDRRRSTFSTRRSLMDMGLDSLELLELRMLLGRRLGVELDATFFFQYGNARAIVRHLEGEDARQEAEAAQFDEDVDLSAPPRVESLLEHVDRAPAQPTEAIAVIGMACRFPGGVTSPDQYWSLLSRGIDAITEIPSSRWDVDRFEGQIATRCGGFLDQVDQFDASFFRIAPREAEQIDPQQRILLEETWKALENAAIDPESLTGSPTGIFVGVFPHDYELLQVRYSPLTAVDPYYGTGNSMSVTAGRLAYFYGATGPAISVDTACSSSLVAVHLACQSLKSGECDLALAAGVNLLLSPELSIAFSHAGMLAPDGRCKTFDASADGYVRSEGCGVVVLKRLSQALSDRDNILAVIRGTAVNQDGASNGLTAPNGLSQEAVIRKALSAAGASPLEVSYVETHGTGTSLGDPIEVKALRAVYGEGRKADNPLRIGSVKTQIGHTEAAAGLAGLMKVVLSLQHGTIAPHLHFKEWNPHIELDGFAVAIPGQAEQWEKESGHARLAAVSSFGFSGTNVHAVLSEAPAREFSPAKTSRTSHLLTLSAQDQEALRQLAERCLESFQGQTDQILPSLCCTSHLGRAHFDHRLAAVAESIAELQELLGGFVEARIGPGLAAGRAVKAPGIGFLFTGQGAQYPGMARQLYQTQPLFRKTLHQCDEILGPYLETSLLDVLYPAAGETSPIDSTAYTQPALFALEYSLAQLWKSWGIEPEVMLGHSVGEYPAACLAGVFSLEDGLKLIAARGRLMQQLPLDGEMAVAFASEETVRAALEPFTESVSIAGFNGPENLTLSGKREDLRSLLSNLEASGVQTVKLNVSHAFHSPLMEPMLAEFECVASEIEYSTPQRKIISNVTGELATEEIATPEYWRRHVRSPVRFTAGMETLHRAGYELFVEIGPKPTLLKMGRFCVPGESGVWLPSLQPGSEDWQRMLETLGELYVRGAAVDWKRFERDYPVGRAPLPTYPFQRRRFWLRDLEQTQSIFPQSPSSGRGRAHPLLGQQLHSALQEILFESRISPDEPAYLKHHRVFEQAVLPASAYMEMALAAAGAALKSEDVLIEDVVIGQAMILPENELTKVQLILAPNSPQASFQIHSLAQADQSSPEAPWSLHVSGKMRAQQVRPEASLVDVVELQARCSQEVSVAAYYQEFRELRGLNYGESFQAIQQLWLSEGEALGRIQVPSLPGAGAYQLHPVALDGAFQILMATFPETARQDVFLPVALECLEVHRSSETDFWAHAQLRQDPSSELVTADLQLFKETGELVAQIDGFAFKRATREAVLRSLQPHRNDLLYEIRWEPTPLPPPLPPEGEAATWLIFEDQSSIGSSLARKLQEQGDRCLRVSPGSSDERASEQRCSIDASSPESFERLLAELADHDFVPSKVVFLGASQGDRQQDLSLGGLLEAQRLGCGAVLHLVQALARADWPQSPQLWLVTQGAQAVGQNSRQTRVEQAPLWGLGRVIRQEHRSLGCVNLDLDPAESDDPAARLLEELRFPREESEIAYREGQRHAARLVRHQRKAAANPLEIDGDGAYLITGGLGALGLETARWLVRAGARNLVLTGRSGASSDQAKAALTELENAGARLLVVKADVSKAEDTADLLNRASEKMPALRGVIHAAGVMDEGSLLDQNWDRFQQVTAPKLQGAWNLHQLTRELPLDFFVCFSSAASLLGSPGLGTYAAANAFLDALAHYRGGMDLPALTVNWGPWELGMVDRMGDRQQSGMAAIGLGPLGAELGIGSLAELLAEPPRQIAVMQMDWSKFLGQFSAGETPRFFQEAEGEIRRLQSGQPSAASVAALLELLAADQSRRPSLAADYLKELVAAVLGSTPDQVGEDIPLNKLGLDSLMALQLRNRIQTELQVEIPMVRFLDQSGLTGLAKLLNDRLPEPAASTAAPVDLAAHQAVLEAARGRSPSRVGLSGDSIIEGEL